MLTKNEESVNKFQKLELHLDNYKVELAFCFNGNRIFLIASDYNARWPSILMRKKWAEVGVSEYKLTGVPHVVGKEEDKKFILGIFKEKYGTNYFEKYFLNPGKIITINLGENRPVNDNYYSWLEEEFDSVAYNYDKHIFGNRINTLLRDRSVEFLTKYLPKKSRILEIGCGTGAETMKLIRDGHEVVAVDISSNMLNILYEKARKEKLSDNLITLKLRASMIDQVIKRFDDGYFDLTYSTFGALNCEPSIEVIPEYLFRLLKKDGYFIAGVYNKFCLSETVIDLVTLRFNRLLWRIKNPIKEGRSRFCLDIYSFSYPEFISLFSPFFTPVSTIGVPVLLPPSNFHRLIDGFGSRYEILKSIDKSLSRLWPFKFLGDHFLVALKRKP